MGAGDGAETPASPWNLCSAQRLCSPLAQWLPPKMGREQGRGWTEPRVCTLGPDQIYFPSHSLCDSKNNDDT